MKANLKTYLTKPTKCFIPKCKAHCCINAPLPEDFLPKHTDKITRKIYSGINIGQNGMEDKYNSIIYNTTPNPLQLVGKTFDGHSLYGISKKMIDFYQIKSQEQLDEIIAKYESWQNYCPFITDYGKCNVYTERPPICREFGTSEDKLNLCPEKSSRLDIMKFYLKDFGNFYLNPVKKIVNKFLNLFNH